MNIRIFSLITVGVLFLSVPAYAQRGTGLNFLDEGQYRSVPLAATPLLGNLPAEVDLSSDFPIPGNQGHQSSCVGWAISYLKTYQEKIERKWRLNDKNHMFSPAFIYNQIKTTASCDGGSNFSDALNLLRKSGMAVQSDFPYDDKQCSTLPSAAINQKAREFAIADWRRVNAQDEAEIKTQIAAGFPVLIGMIVDDKFSQLVGGDVYAGPVGQSRGGHAMVAVGYSDSAGAFKVINSWGAGWGEGGFGWIEYRTFRALVREAFVVQDIVVTRPPRQMPDTPSPEPEPQPTSAATIVMSTPVITHNAMVSTSTGLQPGMQIRVPGTINNAAGRSMQIIVKFNYLNGPPLRANPVEPTFRDAGGLSSTGTALIPVATNSESMDKVMIGMPYYALNFQATGGFNLYNLSLNVTALIDNEPKAQSGQVPFQLRW